MFDWFKNKGANVASKFTSLLNSANNSSGSSPASMLGSNNVSTIANLPNAISSNSVEAVLSSSNGVSHATDLKERMRGIEWSRGYSWDVLLDPGPKDPPFNSNAFGLPVIDVQCNFALLGSPGTIELANSTYSFPQKKDFFTIGLTMLDDENGTMEQFFEKWNNEVYSWDGDSKLNGTINYLNKSVKMLRVTKLNSQKKAIFTRSYLVFPQESLLSINDSSGQVRRFTIQLVIAGYLGKTTESSIKKASNSPTTIDNLPEKSHHESSVSATYTLGDNTTYENIADLNYANKTKPTSWGNS